MKRREFMEYSTLLAAAAMLGPVASAKATEELFKTAVPREKWPTTHVSQWLMDVLREQVEFCLVQGYARNLSVTQGERVELCISSRAKEFDLLVSRVGAKVLPVLYRQRLVGREQAIPAKVSTVGCGWETSEEIQTSDLSPGFYQVDLIARGTDIAKTRALGHAFFVVRAKAGKEGDMLLQLSTNTYNAYNHWGGPCLYEGSTQVAYDRPLLRGFIWRPEAAYDDRYSPPTAAGELSDVEVTSYLKYCVQNNYSPYIASAGWHNQERRFVRWAEQQGYKVDMCINNDVDDAQLLSRYGTVVSVGHDEYWTMKTRDNLLDWVKQGGHFAVFSGNTAYWHVRLESNIMVCHKGSAEKTDPVVGTDKQHLLSSMFVHRWVSKPENELLGVGTNGGIYARISGATPRGSGGFTIYRPDHWSLADTDLRYGDVFGSRQAIASYELCGCKLTFDENGLPVPTGEFGTPRNFEIVGIVPAILWSSDPKYRDYSLVIMPGPGAKGDAELVAEAAYGSTDKKLVERIRRGHGVIGSMTLGKGEVFAGSSTHWAYGLGSVPSDGDPSVEQVTRNVLNRFTGKAI